MEHVLSPIKLKKFTKACLSSGLVKEDRINCTSIIINNGLTISYYTLLYFTISNSVIINRV